MRLTNTSEASISSSKPIHFSLNNSGLGFLRKFSQNGKSTSSSGADATAVAHFRDKLSFTSKLKNSGAQADVLLSGGKTEEPNSVDLAPRQQAGSPGEILVKDESTSTKKPAQSLTGPIFMEEEVPFGFQLTPEQSAKATNMIAESRAKMMADNRQTMNQIFRMSHDQAADNMRTSRENQSIIADALSEVSNLAFQTHALQSESMFKHFDTMCQLLSENWKET